MNKLCSMVALLACSWVLWAVSVNRDNVKPELIGATETKVECESVLMVGLKCLEGPGFQVDRPLLTAPSGHVTKFVCLPDTVRPWEEKK